MSVTRATIPTGPPPNLGGRPGLPENDPRSRLALFVETEVFRFIDFLVTNFRTLAPEQRLRFAELVEQAWQEAGRSFSATPEFLRGLTDDRLGDLRDLGLTGAQLDLKLQTVEAATSELDTETTVAARLNQAEGRSRALESIREEVSYVADGIDNVVGSIARLFPPAGAITEVKHHVTWLVRFGRWLRGPH